MIEKLYDAQDQKRYQILALLKRYDFPTSRGIYEARNGQKKELDALRVLADELKDIFNEFKIIQKPRSKRSLLPIVGKALSFLFGTVSEDDLQSINRNINKLATNQRKISHVVAESLTLLNDTRVHVIQNRQALNNVILSISNLGSQLRNLTAKLEQSILELTFVTTTIVQIGNYLEEIKRTIMHAKFYVEHLKLKFNILSLGHMSPTLILPRQLQRLLEDIKSKLPPHLQLTHDPKNIWTFYKFLTCATIISNEKILVIVSLPLVNIHHKYFIYKVHNFPFPVKNNKTLPNVLKNMVAYRNLESQYIGVNLERSRYMLLKSEDVQQCIGHRLQFCALRQPIYPVNLSRLCVIAVFMDERSSIDRLCQTLVRPNEILPFSEYISDGYYAISTNKNVQFTQVCKKLSASVVTVKPPLGVIKVKPSCSMTNQNLVLPAYFHQESKYNLTNPLSKLVRNFQVSKVKLWKPFHSKLPNLTLDTLPTKLKDIKEIRMDDLISQLQTLDDVTVEEHVAIWPYVILSIGLILFIFVFGLFCYCKCYPKMRKFLKVRREHNQGSHKLNEHIEMTLRQPLTQQMKDVKHTVENGSEPRDIPPMYPVLEMTTNTA